MNDLVVMLSRALSIQEIMSFGGFDTVPGFVPEYRGQSLWERFYQGERWEIGIWETDEGIFYEAPLHNIPPTRINKHQLMLTILVQGDFRQIRRLATELSIGAPEDLAEFAVRSGAGLQTEEYEGPLSERYVFDSDFRAEVKRQIDLEDAKSLAIQMREQKALMMDEAAMWEAKVLGTLLNEEASGPKWRIERVIVLGGVIAIVASAKTGKTTLITNLIWSLCTGEKFLGEFGVKRPAGRIGFMNYELTESQVRSWLGDLEGIDEDKVVVWNLRGKRNPLQTETTRELFAQELKAQSIEVLIVDPFSGAFRRGQNASQDNDLVKEFLLSLDEMKNRAGVSELIIAVHAGRDTSRTRGASALDDHPDALVYLEKEAGTGLRKFRAVGRDVDVSERLLHFNPENKKLSFSDMTVAEGKVLSVEQQVIEALKREGSLTATQLADRIKKRESIVNQARDNLVEKGVIRVLFPGGGKKLFELNPEHDA